jgi:hypothetical protein
VVRDLSDPLGVAIQELMHHGADNDRRIEFILAELRRIKTEIAEREGIRSSQN